MNESVLFEILALSLADLANYAKTRMMTHNPDRRPSLRTVLEHRAFNCDYISIVTFLSDLPLKSRPEKTKFFEVLTTKLLDFPTEIIAKQLGSLLLTRYVFLDESARNNFLPNLLVPVGELVGHLKLHDWDSPFYLHLFRR